MRTTGGRLGKADRRDRARLVGLLALATLLACSGPGASQGPGSAPAGAAMPRAASADDLLVVDCLLPGAVRKLGSKLTYLSARRPIKTSALDCGIRGGEYTSFDRASYAGALSVWMPQAEQGDAQAQNYVGEIYERGPAGQPDYQAAATWYRRAAEQGFAPAQTNLGQLYEQGLGVPRDVGTALRWYRRASGLDELELPFVAGGDAAVELQEMRTKLSEREREIEALRSELLDLQEELRRSREQRSRTREEIERESARLEASRSELDAQRAELASETRRLQEERRSLERRASVKDADTATARAELARLAREIEARQQAAEQRTAALGARETEMEALERSFADKQKELQRLDAQIAKLTGEAEKQQKKVARTSETAEVALAGPSIQLIDPPLSRTRGMQQVSTRPAMKQRLVVGRVDAPAGLLRLLVNDEPAEVQDRGIFQVHVPVPDGGTKVTIVAIDRQGKRGNREFMLKPGEDGEEAGGSSRGRSEGRFDFGRYHALVIGNDAYQRLPRLETARADAQAVGDLLERKYGFRVTRLVDATRYDTLSALNGLRAQLNEGDNLVIYYAGHGELDKVNMRGHWLPVDAESGNTANWISNVDLTDILNAMNARHILVIADSCYSGALTRSSLARLEAGMTDEARKSWMKAMVSKRSRTALTSGGVAPVLDSGGGKHSIFAKALLDVLGSNEEVLEGQRLFQEISARVTWAAEAKRFEQLPQYAPIKFAGHESGDFFLVPGS